MYRPRPTVQSFASEVSHERYDEAAANLNTPSSITLEPNGDLTVEDLSVNRTVVPAEKLPSFVGGEEKEAPSEFTMTALGDSDTPAVMLHLRVVGRGVQIERVDS